MKKTFMSAAILLILFAAFTTTIKAQFVIEVPDSIVVGDSASAGIDLAGKKLVGIIAPASIDQDTVVFWTSSDNITWHKVYLDKGSGSVPLVIGITAGVFNGLYDALQYYFLERYVKIQFGTYAADVDAASTNKLFKLVTGGYQ